jgi:hypothetical protein
MTLPWVRLDTGLPTHPKFIALLEDDPNPARWRAAFSYIAALAWAGANETDGKIPTVALKYVHGTRTTAELLVKHGLWESWDNGYRIHNFDRRQQLATTADTKRLMASTNASRAACARWHGPDCWTEDGCSRTLGPT